MLRFDAISIRVKLMAMFSGLVALILIAGAVGAFGASKMMGYLQAL